MNTKLEQKIVQSKQKSSLDELVQQLGNDFDILELIIHPASGDVANAMKAKAAEIVHTTSHPEELHGLFIRFMASAESCASFTCVLPGVSFLEDTALTRFPVLRTNADGVRKLFTHFLRREDLDFFSASADGRRDLWRVSSVADYPTAENMYFDGAVYTVGTTIENP